ncbi:hypothetical protein Tsubulata_040587, partial [Turnera subulata]
TSLTCCVLLLSLLLLVFRELYNPKSKINTKEIANFSYLPHRPLIINRKVLASKFDFTPFQKHQHAQDHDKHSKDHKQKQEEAAQNEIDPRYGVEKRRVPTGPNPLHH